MTQHTHPNRLLAQIALAILAFAAALPAARAASFTWSGNATGNSTWGNGTNWVGGSAPVTDGTAALSFGGNTTTTSNNTLTANTTFTAINFTNNGSSSQNASFTLNGNALTLNGSITTTAQTAATGQLLDSINMNVILGGNLTVTTNQFNGTNDHRVTINGLISDGGNGYGITKNGTSFITLANGNNTFSGSLTINAGTVGANLIGAYGTNNTVNFNGGTLFYNGIATTISKTFNIVSNSATFQSGTAGMTFNGTIAGLSSGANFTFSGGGGGTLASDISNNGTLSFSASGGWNATGVISGSGSVQATGAGVVTLSNANNSFTGQIAVFSGATMSVTSGGALGNGTSLILLGTSGATPDGVLNYTGSADSTTGRTLKIGNANTSNGTARINIASTGNLTFTTAAFMPTQSGFTTNRTLTLGGNGSGVGTIQGAIIDSSGTSTTSVIKADSGKWVLSGNNTYTGTTAVNGGTLQLNASSGSALGQTSGISVSSGGTLLLSQSNQINNSANMTLAGGTIKFGSAVSEGGNSTVGLGALTLTANSTLDFNSLAGTITFATGFTPGTFKLNVTNWTLNSSHLYFNQDESSFLSSFTVNGLAAQQFSLGNGFYEITAVPEPGTIAAGLAIVGFIAWRERKRLAPIVRRSKKSAVIS